MARDVLLRNGAMNIVSRGSVPRRCISNVSTALAAVLLTGMAGCGFAPGAQKTTGEVKVTRVERVEPNFAEFLRYVHRQSLINAPASVQMLRGDVVHSPMYDARAIFTSRMVSWYAEVSHMRYEGGPFILSRSAVYDDQLGTVQSTHVDLTLPGGKDSTYGADTDLFLLDELLMYSNGNSFRFNPIFQPYETDGMLGEIAYVGVSVDPALQMARGVWFSDKGLLNAALPTGIVGELFASSTTKADPTDGIQTSLPPLPALSFDQQLKAISDVDGNERLSNRLSIFATAYGYLRSVTGRVREDLEFAGPVSHEWRRVSEHFETTRVGSPDYANVKNRPEDFLRFTHRALYMPLPKLVLWMSLHAHVWAADARSRVQALLDGKEVNTRYLAYERFYRRGLTQSSEFVEAQMLLSNDVESKPILEVLEKNGVYPAVDHRFGIFLDKLSDGHGECSPIGWSLTLRRDGDDDDNEIGVGVPHAYLVSCRPVVTQMSEAGPVPTDKQLHFRSVYVTPYGRVVAEGY